jgi:hypothetical protein
MQSKLLAQDDHPTHHRSPRLTLGLMPLHSKTEVLTYEHEEEVTTVGRILYWLDVRKQDKGHELLRWLIVHCLAPLIHILRSGYELSVYVTRSADVPRLDEGFTVAFLNDQCTKLGLTEKLHKALVTTGEEIQYVHPTSLLGVLDTVINSTSFTSELEETEDELTEIALKRLMRLQFVLRHLVEMNDDHYNIYASAYLNPTIYGSRAIVTALAQAFSTCIILGNMMSTRRSILHMQLLDAVLISVFELWMITNIPSYLLPNTLSRNALLAVIFCREGRSLRAGFIVMDIFNQMIVLIMPVMGALALTSSQGTMNILFNSLSVLFVISLDELSFSSGEKVYIGSSVNDLIEDTLLNLDDYGIPASLRFMAILPLIEMSLVAIMGVIAVIALF